MMLIGIVFCCDFAVAMTSMIPLAPSLIHCINIGANSISDGDKTAVDGDIDDVMMTIILVVPIAFTVRPAIVNLNPCFHCRLHQCSIFLRFC